MRSPGKWALMEKKEDSGLSPGARLWVQVEERKGEGGGKGDQNEQLLGQEEAQQKGSCSLLIPQNATALTPGQPLTLLRAPALA